MLRCAAAEAFEGKKPLAFNCHARPHCRQPAYLLTPINNHQQNPLEALFNQTDRPNSAQALAYPYSGELSLALIFRRGTRHIRTYIPSLVQRGVW